MASILDDKETDKDNTVEDTDTVDKEKDQEELSIGNIANLIVMAKRVSNVVASRGVLAGLVAIGFTSTFFLPILVTTVDSMVTEYCGVDARERTEIRKAVNEEIYPNSVRIECLADNIDMEKAEVAIDAHADVIDKSAEMVIDADEELEKQLQLLENEPEAGEL